MRKTELDRLAGLLRRQEEDQVGFVRRLCNENSYTYNPPGTNRVADMVLDRLGGFLPHHKAVRQAAVGDHHILRTGKGLRAVCVLGHLDTVFPPEHPFQRCRRVGEWLVGPGTGDMKGGIAVIVYAMKALGELGLMDNLNIALLLSADEEIGAVSSEPIYRRERKRAAACLVAECGGSDGEFVVSRNGKAGARLECFGRDRHVGRVTGGKRNANLEIAHKIIALEGLNDYLPGATVNIGKIEGGLGPCTVSGHAECLLDIRWQDEKHFAQLERRINRILREQAQPGCRCRLTLLNRRPAMPLTAGTKRMFDRLKHTASRIGLDIKGEHRRGTSDANYFGSVGVPTIDGFGPICEDDHTSKERILVSSLYERTLLLALFLAGLGETQAYV